MDRLKRFFGRRLTSEVFDGRLGYVLIILGTPSIAIMALRKMLRLSAGPMRCWPACCCCS